MALSRESFLRRKSGKDYHSVKLADGGVVLLKPATAKLYRDYKRSLRDKDGMPIPEKQAYGDELLIAAMLVDPSGQPLVTEEDVLAGALDEHSMADLVPIIRRAYQLVGLGEADEDREKNSLATDSTEPS